MPARNFERRIWLLTALAALPGLGVSLFWRFTTEAPDWRHWMALVICILFPVGLLLILVRSIRFPLRTLSNQIAGMREGDFSIRVRGATSRDAMGELIAELNALGAHLREHRLEGVETEALLRTVMGEISVCVFAFDQQQRLQLVNRAGEQLLGRSAAQMTGRSAQELGLAACLEGEPTRVLDTAFHGQMGRWALRRSSFREQGQPHQLVVLTDLSRALREEERQAWKRLIRVMGHELNNSLAPIHSISSSLTQLLDRQPRPDDWEDDVRGGLSVVRSRSESLIRFMEAYSRLARLPAPTKRPFNVREWAGHAVQLEQRLTVQIVESPDVTIHGDADQLDQVLINLIRNATDAALADPGGADPAVEILWHLKLDQFVLTVRDNGPGVADSGNLFVPFFTTKQGGSGIGLALCRQIVEGHDGRLTLANRSDGRGAEAIVRLPLAIS